MANGNGKIVKADEGINDALARATTTGGIAKVQTSEGGTPFVSVLQDSTKKKDEIQKALPGIEVGQMYYHSPETGYKRINELRFHLLESAQYWVKRNKADQVEGAKTVGSPDFKDPFKSNVETIIVVYVDDVPVPALASFRYALDKIPGTASDMFSMFEDPAKTAAWAARKPENKVALSIGVPSYRFSVVASTYQKPSKSGGNPYTAARATAEPITAAQLKLLSEAVSSDKFTKQLETVKKAYDIKVKALADAAAKTTT